MEPWVITFLSLLYLALLFVLAYFVEKKSSLKKIIIKNKWVYALALPVYCTAWTYYGSVGKAVSDGWEFLTIYIGAIICMPLWWIVVRKIIRICEIQRISSLSDFIVSRFDKSITLSVFSTSFIVLGIIPYISIQLKSIAQSFDILTQKNVSVSSVSPVLFLNDSAFYLSLILAFFIVLFVFKSIETTDKHSGMMSAIAVDSIVKLIAFLTVGVYVTYFLFDGFGDILNQIDERMLNKITNIPTHKGFDWFFMVLLSMTAIVLLPRQFQVAVAENTDEGNLKTASWVFPLYLLLINIFVVPIALGGQLSLPSTTNPDNYVLALPLYNGQEGLAFFSFLGGFSAATGMIIVSTIALSLMVSNNLIIPLLLRNSENKKVHSYPLTIRRIAVFVIIFLSYLNYKYITFNYSLVSIGLISFAAMIQFAPLVVASLYWKDANKYGALLGLGVGFLVWTYTLVLPTLAESGFVSNGIVEKGILGITQLKPQALFGLPFGPIAQGTFWSLSLNIFFFLIGSLLFRQSAKERNMAEFYVDIYKYTRKSEEKIVWKGQLKFQDLYRVCENLIGAKKTQVAIEKYKKRKLEIFDENEILIPSFVNYIERIMSGVVGSASARILIASLSKEEEIEISDVIKILKKTSETTQLNAQLQYKTWELKKQSEELIRMNERLKNLDKEKDDFISTVTHEMRTPLSSIKAFVEILSDNPDLTQKEKKKFLSTVNEEIDRMTRLLNQVLDIEKYEANEGIDEMTPLDLNPILTHVIDSVSKWVEANQISLKKKLKAMPRGVKIYGNEDRLYQVFLNLISNAIKYCEPKKGKISVESFVEKQELKILIKDNGKGIEAESRERIFDKFYQARDQTLRKPKGTGLGLSISKKVIEAHKGNIQVQSEKDCGATFIVSLPLVEA